MASEPAPAIRGRLDERYSDIERIDRIGSDTTFYRGLGDVGTIVDLVDLSEMDLDGCPRCGESEMVLSKVVRPETVDAEFYCTNIKCPHFVADAVEYDMDRIRADGPHVWDNTAVCPDCETRHTVRLTEMDKYSYEYESGDADDGGVVYDLCEKCLGRATEVEA